MLYCTTRLVTEPEEKPQFTAEFSAGCMGISLTEMLFLFQDRRKTELAMLRTYGGDVRTVRRLHWGCIGVAVGSTCILCGVFFLFLI